MPNLLTYYIEETQYNNITILLWRLPLSNALNNAIHVRTIRKSRKAKR